MKVGEYEKFSEFCGIAKVEHDGEVIFIAFSDYMENDKWELGKLIGKGKTEIEALRMALVKLSDNTRKMIDEVQEIENKINKLRIISNPLNFDDDPIISIEGWKYSEEEEDTMIDSGEFHNADVRIDSDGKVCLGLC